MILDQVYPSCHSIFCIKRRIYWYSSTSLVRGFWDEIFWPSKPRTTEEPRTKEGHIKVDIGTKLGGGGGGGATILKYIKVYLRVKIGKNPTF